MAKPTSRFVCQSCGAVSPKWAGRCESCGEWNSIVEEAIARPGSTPGPVGKSASGKRVDKSDAHVDAGDPTLLVVSVPPLAAGKYRVTWRVLSVDTHVTEGDFDFDVVP